jgi:hypothetical protein
LQKEFERMTVELDNLKAAVAVLKTSVAAAVTDIATIKAELAIPVDSPADIAAVTVDVVAASTALDNAVTPPAPVPPAPPAPPAPAA